MKSENFGEQCIVLKNNNEEGRRCIWTVLKLKFCCCKSFRACLRKKYFNENYYFENYCILLFDFKIRMIKFRIKNSNSIYLDNSSTQLKRTMLQ